MIEVYLQRQDSFLEEFLKNYPIPAPEIHSAIHYVLKPSGKRIRALLVYLTGELFDIPLAILDVIATSIELTHCYSLIHDDLPAMDNDDYRRGRLSCHKAYDEATAILVGDGLQALAIELLLTKLSSHLAPLKVIGVTQVLVRASGIAGMVSGQSLDLTELAKPLVTEEKLQHIHLLKTGKLIQACIEMVLAATNAEEAVFSALKTYSSRIGLVFQLQDDYLDCYASADVLGKGRSSDKANQKTTFASLCSKEQLEEKIGLLYREAIGALEVFGEKAKALIDFTKTLERRSLDVGPKGRNPGSFVDPCLDP